jgi:hypothetical protein
MSPRILNLRRWTDVASFTPRPLWESHAMYALGKPRNGCPGKATQWPPWESPSMTSLRKSRHGRPGKVTPWPHWESHAMATLGKPRHGCPGKATPRPLRESARGMFLVLRIPEPYSVVASNAGVHKHSKNLAATSKFQTPEG